jgi:hypothetical protein
MSKKIFGLMAAGLAFATIAVANIGFSKSAEACGKISCAMPVGIAHGQKAPVWKVAYCVVGNPGSFTKVDCKSPAAVHTSPLGKPVVCFIGTDGKPHWDAQSWVWVGRKFINHFANGRWQPDYQS